MRKLVTVRRISEILPIPDAELIERARIDGWNVVVRKGEFRAGDLCIYGEIDSVFPSDDERFAFLEGKRLKTKKLRGVVSQGIAFPASILGNLQFKEGDEVTEILRVVKYEPPPPKGMDAKGEFPWFIQKTDAERAQNLITELNQNLGSSAYVSEKLDGSSITIFCRLDEGVWQTGLCSRNQELKIEGKNHFTRTTKRLNVIERLEEFCKTDNRQIALQGELIGPGVQGNRYDLAETDIRFFNVFDIAEYKKVSFDEFVGTIEKLGMQTVPIVQDSYILHNDIEKYLSEAEKKSELNPKTEREGIVFRTFDGSFDFKSISNRFLLKND